jgi:uncharacterized membrane protein (DUF485 family)
MPDGPRELHHIAAERWKIAATLTAAMMVLYFGLILLIAFNKPLLGTIVVPGLSLGILLGVLVIVSAWVLIWIYARWANRHYDTAIAQHLDARSRASDGARSGRP